MMNVGLEHGRVDPQLRAVLEAEIDRGADHRVIDGMRRLGGEPVEGAVERVVLRHPFAIELSEVPQRVRVRNPFAQLPIVPVLQPPQDQRPEDLRGGSGRAVPSPGA